MKNFVWNLHQWGRRLGKTGIAGLVLLALAALLQGVDVAPLRAEVDAGAARIAELETAAARRSAREAAASAASDQAVKAALPVAATPTITVAGERVRELLKFAAQHGIVLSRGQYTPAPVGGTTLVRWQILLPVDAPYPAIRRFIADSLAAMPTLALEDFRIKRETIGADQVEAELRFNLYLQEALP